MNARTYTAWGTVCDTGAASIDVVLIEASRPMSIREIEEEVRRRGLPERGAVSAHLNTLKKRGYITSTPKGWCRSSMASSEQARDPSAVDKTQNALATIPTSSQSSAGLTPSTAPTDRTERIQRIKLTLETGVVVVTLISSIAALLFRFK